MEIEECLALFYKIAEKIAEENGYDKIINKYADGYDYRIWCKDQWNSNVGVDRVRVATTEGEKDAAIILRVDLISSPVHCSIKYDDKWSSDGEYAFSSGLFGFNKESWEYLGHLYELFLEEEKNMAASEVLFE